MIESQVPYLTSDDEEFVIEALRTSKGPRRSQFQDLLKERLRTLYQGYSPVFFSHCTNAMYSVLLALKCLNRDPKRSEIIIPAMSWVSTASTVINAGLVPVFVDIEFDSACIDLDAVEQNITEKTLGVMCVGLYGNMNIPTKFLALKNKFKEIVWLEDAAESFGSKDLKTDLIAGSFGDISFLSFHSTKLVNAGQGGVALFRDSELANYVSIQAHHGIDTAKTGKYYWSESLGNNYAWSDISAALAYSQIRRLEVLVAERRKIFFEYEKLLSGHGEKIQLQSQLLNINQVYWLPYFLSNRFADPIVKKLFFSKALEKDISFRPLFYPLVEMPPFSPFVGGVKSEDELKKKFPNSFLLSSLGVSLPTGAYLDEKSVNEVSKFIIDFMKTQ